MACENSFKVVRVAFKGCGGGMDHFIRPDDPRSINRLIAFLRDTGGLIVCSKGLSDEDAQQLRGAERDFGRPLLASPDPDVD